MPVPIEVHQLALIAFDIHGRGPHSVRVFTKKTQRGVTVVTEKSADST